MASISSSSMTATSGFTPPITPPSLAMMGNTQFLIAASNIRRSARFVKPTEKASQLKTPKRANEVPVTPTSSPAQKLIGKNPLPPEATSKSVEVGKSDQYRQEASTRPKVMLRFAPNVVQGWKSSRDNSTISPSPSPPITTTAIATPISTSKKHGKTKSANELKSTRIVSNAAASIAPMSTSESNPNSLSDNILPSIENVTEDQVEEVGAQATTGKKTPTKCAKKPASESRPKRRTTRQNAGNLDTQIDTPSQESRLNSQTSSNNEAAKEVEKQPVAASKKRSFANSESAKDQETTNVRNSKIQKVSPSGRKQKVVTPEAIVETDPPGPDELELTAWLFAYGKEGSEKYMRDKFPTCNIAAYGFAKLENYKFVLNSDGYAKAIKENGSELYGAIWMIPEKIRSTLEKKAAKHGMKYVHVEGIQPMRKHPDYEPNMWNVPWVPHAEPLKCFMGVCEKMDGNEEKGKTVVEDDFDKRRGLSRVIMEMEMAGVPHDYTQNYIRSWVPAPRNSCDTGYHVDHKRVKPSKKQ